MSPVTHLLTGWVLAAGVGLPRRERAVVTAAAVIPDIDGLGVVPELLTRNSSHPLNWFTLYHHSLHNLAFGIVVSMIAFGVCKERWRAAILSLVAFHLHLLEDLLGSRGPDGYAWPISYWSPFSSASWSWRGQWALNSWQNIAITVALLCTTFYISWRKGISPVEFVSTRGDRALTATLRNRFS